jgi:cytoskeletal protein CcmA (bactofilin family)
MFSKSKEQPEAIVPQAAAPKRGTRNSGVPSIISAELIVRGTLVSAGDIQIDGRVDGDVRANSLVIGDKAALVGDVYAEEAVVRGRVEGSIRARKVQLCATCHVEGNILHEALSVEIGAFFEGNCRHSDNPLADAPVANVAERRPAAAPPLATAAHAAAERRIPHGTPALAPKTAAEPVQLSAAALKN